MPTAHLDHEELDVYALQLSFIRWPMHRSERKTEEWGQRNVLVTGDSFLRLQDSQRSLNQTTAVS
jgi:hypothetical protein